MRATATNPPTVPPAMAPTGVDGGGTGVGVEELEEVVLAVEEDDLLLEEEGDDEGNDTKTGAAALQRC